MKKFQNLLFTTLFAIIGGFISIFIYSHYVEKPQVVTIKEPASVQYANLPAASEMPDLTYAAENSVKSVVHIQTSFRQQNYYSQGGNSLFDFFFGNPYQQNEPRVQQASGSGVIISNDGYIVTNNHVIEKSEKIKVTLHDNRTYDAKLIGTDPSTDIALIKIDEEDLPSVVMGNSDELKLGQWVLAVGNPFNLTSTVTAGIVSAKGRGLNIIADRMGIESFIQTDAAVNPGNSGGALVDTRGYLVGINTAIASRTGSYSGYSFAVPVSIVKKVVSDLKEFGEVQRAMLGVGIRTVNSDLAEKEDIDEVEGVFIEEVYEESAAKEAGLKKGDIIIAINETTVNTVNELQEQISRHSPGDKIDILVKRNNKEKLFTANLRNTKGGFGIVKNSITVLGAELEKISEKTKQKLNIDYGLVVKDLSSGKLDEAGVKEGFIITHVNKQPVNSVQQMKDILKVSRGGVLIEGIYPNGEDAYYVFGLQ